LDAAVAVILIFFVLLFGGSIVLAPHGVLALITNGVVAGGFLLAMAFWKESRRVCVTPTRPDVFMRQANLQILFFGLLRVEGSPSRQTDLGQERSGARGFCLQANRRTEPV
jgi:hypothetical protein